MTAVTNQLLDTASLRIKLSDFLSKSLGRPVVTSELRRYPSGFSWITYGCTIDAPGVEGCNDLILRLGPANGLFAPYSAEPQHEVLKALETSDVPAPRSFLWSDDPSILGAPFFLSERSPGETPIPWGDDPSMTGSRLESLGAQFADALGSLHAIDWSVSGLARGAVGMTPNNAAHLQIDVWEADYQRWALRPHPMMHKLLGWLRANAPTAPRLSIIHGDYRLGNFLEVSGTITAVLDWELVHIGDPHEDLAWMCLPQYRGGTPLMSKLILREELYRRHEARTGHPVNPASMRYYTLFSLMKLAATHMAGVYAFEKRGFHDMRMPAMGTQIAPVLRQAEKALAEALEAA